MSHVILAVALFLGSWLVLRPRSRPLGVRLRQGIGVGSLVRGVGSSPASATHRGRPTRPGSRSVSTEDVAVAADMLAVAVAAGCPVRQALAEVGSADSGRVRSGPLGSAADHLNRGAELAEVLDTLADAGRGWHSLATQLSLSADSGAPASETLRRLASQERLHVRRERERAARRLPVLLLLPLTTMVLPAFLLVTVVPFVVSSGASLELPPSNVPTANSQGTKNHD